MHIGLAVAVLAAGLLATAAGALEVDGQRDQREQARFVAAARSLSSDLEHEVDRYEDASTAAARYLSLATPVSNDEFMAWGRGGLLDDYPGLRAITFVSYVPAADLDAFVAGQRAAGDPDFALMAQAQAQDYFIVTAGTPEMVTPAGTDLGGSTERRAAFARARDTGRSAITSGFTLVTDQALPADQQQLAFAVYAPVYAKGLPVGTVAQRREALVGWAAAALRGQELLDAMGIGRREVGFELFDGREPTASSRYGSSSPELPRAGDAERETLQWLEVAGRQWTMRAATLDDFSDGSGAPLGLLVAAGAAISTVLAAAALRFITRSDRRQAGALEQQRREQAEVWRVEQERKNQIFGTLQEGLVLQDPDGQIVSWNPAAEQLLGLTSDQLAGRTPYDPSWRTVREDGTPLPAGELPMAIARITGQPVSDTVVGVKRSDGSTVWLVANARPVIDRLEETVLGIVVSFADVTAERAGEAARQAAQTALLEAEATQRASLDALEQGVAMSDLAGNVLLLNRTGERLLGLTADELTERYSAGQWVAHDEEGEELPLEQRPLWHTMDTGEPVHGAVVGWMRPDGKLLTFRISTESVMGPAGRVGVVTAFFDITEQRRTERKQQIAEAALDSERARFEALIERSTDIICVVDGAGHLTYASPAGQRLLGYETGSKVGVSFAELVHPDDLPVLIEAFADLLKVPGGVGSIEARIRREGGGWCHTEVVATNRLDDPAVAGIVANVRDITERAEAAARLSWQAFHDALTGLPNRSLLLDRLQHAIDRGRRTDELTALLFIDLDHFKLVNDTMGHEAGDLLLVELAQRLQAVVRLQDTVARLGGDEFVVLAEALTSVDEAEALARRLNRAMAQPIVLPGGEVTVSGSIGIAFDVDHRPETILRDADTALYRAKERGKNRHEVFNDALRLEAMRRLGTEKLLRGALDEPGGRGIAVHYQPIVDLNAGSLIACEALLRVADGRGGMASAAELVAVAEETGLIVALGARVLDEACGQLARWRSEMGHDAPQRVSVNVAARELSAPDFDGLVQRTLDRHGLEPHHLSLELTETTIIGADNTGGRTLERLHELGVGLSVDDFGTGYSSLAYMKRFPIDTLKIDLSLVDSLGVDDQSTEIVKAVISLGHSLGLLTVAEGIETPEQLEMLRTLGCDAGQGYHLAAPAAGDSLVLLVERMHAPR